MRRIIKNINLISVLSLLLLFVGFGLRFFPFFTKPFWEDEMYSYFFATSPYSLAQHIFSPLDDRPPLFYLMIKAVAFVTTQEQVLRLPGLLLSVFALYILYLAFRNTHKLAAITVLFLSAFSLFQIDLSWQLRDYAIQIFITSMLVFASVRIFQNIVTNTLIQYRYFIWLSAASLTGCLLNHVYIPFVIAIHLSLIVFLFIFSHRNWLFGLILSILSVFPAMLAAGYYLYKQTNVIKFTVQWIPKASIYLYVSLFSAFLGITKNFEALQYLTQDLLYEEFSYSIGIIVVLCIFIIICLMHWKDETNEYKTIVLYSIFGFSITILNIVGISIASIFVGHELFVPRAFTPAQVMYVTSVGLLTGVVIKKSVQAPYVKWVLLAGMVIYVSLCWNIYRDHYNIKKTASPKIDGRDEMMIVSRSLYVYGDQVVFIPFYLRDSYLYYLWRNERSKNYDILATSLLNNSTSTKTIQEIFLYSLFPKVIFVIDVRLQDISQKDIFAGLQSQYLTYFERAKSFCLETPIEKLHNDSFIVSICNIAPQK